MLAGNTQRTLIPVWIGPEKLTNLHENIAFWGDSRCNRCTPMSALLYRMETMGVLVMTPQGDRWDGIVKRRLTGSISHNVGRAVVSWGLLAIIALATVGCTKAVTEAECDKAYNALIEIRTAGEPKLVRMVKMAELNKKRPQFLAACVGQVDREVLNCWYSARTDPQLRQCDRKQD